MRKVILAAVLMLGGCEHFNETEHGSRVVPLVSPEPSKPHRIRAGSERLLTVDQLYAWCEDGMLKMQVTATARSSGWRDVDLNRLAGESTTPVFEVTGLPPKRPGSQALQSFTFRYDEPMDRGMGRVKVIGQSNEMTTAIFIGRGC